MSPDNSIEPTTPTRRIVLEHGPPPDGPNTRRPKRRYPGWRKRISSLSGDQLLGAYEAEWLKGENPPLSWDDLERMLRDRSQGSWRPDMGQEVALHARRFRHVRQSLEPLRDSLLKTVTVSHTDLYLPIIMAIDTQHDLCRFYHDLFADAPASTKALGIGELVKETNRVDGRERTRQQIAALLDSTTLLEQEWEALVEATIKSEVYDWQPLPSLAPEAPATAITLLRRGSLSPRDLGPFFNGEPPQIPGPHKDQDPVVRKFRSLAQRASIPTRLTGAGLKPEEMARLETTWLHPILSALALDQFRRAFHHPMIEELFHFWAHEWPFPLQIAIQGMNDAQGMPTLGIPLIRLLHMRLLLDTPSLASSVKQPESSFLPEVMLHMLGREGVTYSPQLHLSPNSEKGWRRRWAESTGEALSSLFLEDALALDLTTLVRINETTAEETPDFMSRTFSGENIVFESKGATTWKTFCKSKRKAMKQLAKTGSTTVWQQNIGWKNANSKGRTFACCLFATTGEEAQPSQFHVEDPPFAFERLFHEGWEMSARRRHYTAVLQAAGLTQQATAFADGDTFESPSNFLAQKEIPLPDGTPAKFVGTQRNLSELAATIGFPGPPTGPACRVFTGLEADILHRLINRQTPPGRPYGIVSNRSDDSSRIPPFGFISSPRSRDFSKGVYSRLSNGSFLAIEIQE